MRHFGRHGLGWRNARSPKKRSLKYFLLWRMRFVINMEIEEMDMTDQELQTMMEKRRRAPQRCCRCRELVELDRRIYETPLCHDCLPPPEASSTEPQ